MFLAHADGVGADSGSSVPSGDVTTTSFSLGSEDTVPTKPGDGRWLDPVTVDRAYVVSSNPLSASVGNPVEFDLL